LFLFVDRLNKGRVVLEARHALCLLNAELYHKQRAGGIVCEVIVFLLYGKHLAENTLYFPFKYFRKHIIYIKRQRYQYNRQWRPNGL
jgi:hypothetical protein